jgi:solute carrier family 50 protein (sugar transporter)
MMYLAPLDVMRRVVETKSVEYMLPLFLQIMGFLNGACWTAYALVKSDLYIGLPNGLGVLVNLAQLIIYTCYYKSSPNPNKDKKVELPTVRTKPNKTINGSTISINALDLEQQAQQHAQHYRRD